MESAFVTYFKLGLEHITDIQAYDHMLFLLALCAVYTFSERAKVFWLVTAFTVGHSVTLALSAFDILSFNQSTIEFLIPITIILTALLNLLESKKSNEKSTYSKVWLIKYAVVMAFGFIHGMGFSTYFKALMGKTSNIVNFLFAFNVGVEVGQILVVILILLFAWLFLNVLKINTKTWNYSVSGLTILASLYLIWGLL